MSRRNDRKLFREFEHTGDLGIELEAPTRVELFANAALALAHLMVAAEGISPYESRLVETFAETDEDLIHDMLAAALNVFLADGFIWCKTRAEERPGGVAVTLSGERYDPRRHQLLTEIKAVTYHELQVGRSRGLWRARIVFDV